jgi:hypothetical protein
LALHEPGDARMGCLPSYKQAHPGGT